MTTTVQLLEAQTVVPDDYLDFARGFIARCRFVTPKDLRFPHQYCLRDWLDAEGQADYDRFLQIIGYHGYNGRFWRQTWRYINVDDYRYWESLTLDGTGGRIINRATLNGSVAAGHCCKLGEATGLKHHARSCVHYGS